MRRFSNKKLIQNEAKSNEKKMEKKKKSSRKIMPYWDSKRRSRQQSLFPSPSRYLSNRSNGAFITILILCVIINIPAPPIFKNTLILYNGKTLPLFVNRTVVKIKVQVHDQIFFAKDCMPCNCLCRNCSCYRSIFRRCLSLNKGLPL